MTNPDTLAGGVKLEAAVKQAIRQMTEHAENLNPSGGWPGDAFREVAADLRKALAALPATGALKTELLETLNEWFAQRSAGQPTTNSEEVMWREVHSVLSASPPVQSGGETEPVSDQPLCEDCNGTVHVWFAPNKLWNLVKGGPE